MNTNETNTNRPATLTCDCGTEWDTTGLLDAHRRWNTGQCLDCFLAKRPVMGEAALDNAVAAVKAANRQRRLDNPGFEPVDAHDAWKDARLG